MSRLFAGIWAGPLRPFALVACSLAFNGPGALGGPIPIPNASFESPTTSFINLNLDSWQKSPKPDWYVEGGGLLWSQLVGAFKNTPFGQFDHIYNCHSNQAVWLFAVPEVSLFQDYDTVDWDDSAPSHAFNATFQTGKAYCLRAGVLVGMGAGRPMQQGVTMDLRLYYRDEATNRVAIATTTITNTSTIFSNANYLFDYKVVVPLVNPADAWAGKPIGIEFASTVSSNMQGGYWDLDNVRLLEMSPPVLSAVGAAPAGFQLSLSGEPGEQFEILAVTNLALPVSEWLAIGVVTNTAGTVTFTDPETNSASRFYQARWLP